MLGCDQCSTISAALVRCQRARPGQWHCLLEAGLNLTVLRDGFASIDLYSKSRFHNALVAGGKESFVRMWCLESGIERLLQLLHHTCTSHLPFGALKCFGMTPARLWHDTSPVKWHLSLLLVAFGPSMDIVLTPQLALLIMSAVLQLCLAIYHDLAPGPRVAAIAIKLSTCMQVATFSGTIA